METVALLHSNGNPAIRTAKQRSDGNYPLLDQFLFTYLSNTIDLHSKNGGTGGKQRDEL